LGAGVVGRGGAFFCTLFSPDFPPCPDGVVEGRGFAGCRKTLKCCHSERSEESRSAAQGKLREGSRSECFQGNARFFVAGGSSAGTRRVSPLNSAGVARTCFLGPRLVSDGQGKAADLKNRSALPFLGPSFCLSRAAARLSMLRMTVPTGFSAACLAPISHHGMHGRDFGSEAPKGRPNTAQANGLG